MMGKTFWNKDNLKMINYLISKHYFLLLNRACGHIEGNLYFLI